MKKIHAIALLCNGFLLLHAGHITAQDSTRQPAAKVIKEKSGDADLQFGKKIQQDQLLKNKMQPFDTVTSLQPKKRSKSTLTAKKKKTLPTKQKKG